MPEAQPVNNPIIPGFSPDPSICAVGDDFYLANSSFAYFPGIPIHHSRDLVHWERIGQALTRPGQLPLEGKKHSHGIFAPTLRWHKGTFYLICTVVPEPGTFVVTASDPAGPWSDPHWIADTPGIDPSLFFDDDGRCWYCGTRPAPEGPKYGGNWEVWLREFDVASMALVGEIHQLWRGALRDAIWPEGPHIYKIDGAYFLLIAEGGTSHHHAISIARSDKISGPYVGNPGNPILSHRHFGNLFPIVNVGHADIFRTKKGEWWMALLASRPYGGLFCNRGRETFLCPVAWEDGWPVASPGRGRVEFSYPAPDLDPSPFPARLACEHFDEPALGAEWFSIRTPPAEPFFSLTERPGFLRLKLRPPAVHADGNPSCVLRSQADESFLAATSMDFVPGSSTETAGILILQNEDWQFRLEVAGPGGASGPAPAPDEGPLVRAVSRENGVETLLGSARISGGKIWLKAEARGQSFSFWYAERAGDWKLLADGADGRILSTEKAGGFVGTCLGLFASSNGGESRNAADFDWFEYRGTGERLADGI